MNKYFVRAQFEIPPEGEMRGGSYGFEKTMEADNPFAAGLAVGLSAGAMLADKMGRQLIERPNEMAEASGSGATARFAALSGATLLAFAELVMRGRARGLAEPQNPPVASCYATATGNGKPKATPTKARRGSGRKRAGNAKSRARA